MILKVDTLKEGVLEELETEYNPAKLDLEFVDFHYLKPVAVNGTAERIKQTVTFRGLMTSQIDQTCARCLEHVQSTVSTPFDLSYDIHGMETIDTTNDLRDLLILGHPDQFLCTTNCRGICARCGANLNRESCRCQSSSEISATWDRLKDVIKKKGS